MANRSVSATATGTLDSGNGLLYSAILTAGVDAAVVTIRSGGAGGTVLFKLGAAAGTTAERCYNGCVAYNGDLHLTVDSGTTPTVEVEI